MLTSRLAYCQTPAVSIFHRLPMAALTCAAALLVGVALAWAQSFAPFHGNTPPTGPPETSDQATRPRPNQRIREGTQIVDQLGYFEVTGDRVTFVPARSKRRLVALENLNLERVVRAIAENPARLQWAVTGTMTEYRGANYLLVRRTVLKSRVQSAREDSRVPEEVGKKSPR